MPLDPPIDPQVLFEKHGAFVSGLARAMVADEHMAEDLAHETWAAVLRRPPVGVRNMRAWLSTILQRRVASHRRRARSGARVGPLDADSALEAQEADQQLEYEQVLHGAVRALGEPYRTVIFLRFHEGLPPRAIADRTGVPVKTVKTRLSRALAKLRVTLDGEFGSPADGGRDWRLALAPIWGSTYVASKGVSTAAVIPLGSSTAPLFLGMKKLIVAAVLLLVSIGWFVQRVEPVGRDQVTRSDGKEGVSLVALEPEGQVVSLEETARREELKPEAQAPEPAATTAALDDSVIVVHVKDAAGEPVEGRTVVLKESPWARAGEPWVIRRTDGAGRVAFAGLRPSHFNVSDGQGRKDENVELKRGETKTFTWTVMDDVLVRGLVVDHAGEPVIGADIWCSTSGDSSDPMWFAGHTDANGAFVLSCSPTAVLQSTAHALLPSSSRGVQSLPEVSSGVREVTLLLGLPGGTLSGRVVDWLGVPIEGATVSVKPVGWPKEWEAAMDPEGAAPRPTPALSDEDGRFELPPGLPKGDHPVIVRAMGFAAMVSTVYIAEGSNDVEFVLHRGVEVSGTVIGVDGNPAASAHVWTALPGSTWQAYGRGEGASVQSDDQGRFTLRRVLPGRTVVRARAGWKEVLTKDSVEVEVGDRSTRGLELVLEMGRTISGRTVDDDGYPVAGAVVTAICWEVRSSDVRSGADGYFQISALPEPDGTADEWDLVVRTWTGASTRLLGRRRRVVPNSAPVDIVVERVGAATGTIVGRIATADGRIPGDVQASLGHQGRSGGTPLAFDPDTGEFSKGPLRPGTYRIELSRAGVPITAKSSLVVGPDETIDVGVIPLDDNGSIEVRPVLPRNSSYETGALETVYAAASASVVGPGGNQVWLEWEDGAWRHSGTLETGVWRVMVFPETLVFPARDVTVEAGEVTRVDVTGSSGRRVRVQVELPTEATWSEVQVVLRDGAGGVLHDFPSLLRQDLGNLTETEVEWVVPVGTLQITVTTDTDVGLETSFPIAPGDAEVLTLPVTAR